CSTVTIVARGRRPKPMPKSGSPLFLSGWAPTAVLSELGKYFSRGLECECNFVFAVSGRHETGFEGRRGKVDALPQHPVKEPAEAGYIARGDLGESAHRRVITEDQAEHAAAGFSCDRDAGFLCQRLQALDQRPGFLRQRFVEARLLEFPQGREARRHRERIAGEGACLVNRPVGSE